MVIRRCYPLILLVMSFLLVSGVVVAVNVGTAGPASAAPEIAFCLTNAPTYCADVMNSNNTSGASIWLYRTNDGAKDYKWLEVPVPCNDTYCICTQNACVEFEDVQNQNLCLGIRADREAIVLVGCELDNLQGGTQRAAWYPLGGNNWASPYMGAIGLLTVNGPLQDGRYLFPAPHVNPGTKEWQQWSETVP